MKTSAIILTVIVVSILSGCSVISGIFNAGVGVGIFVVVLVIALLFFLISRFGKK
jgi:hypothetical protein